MGAFAGSATIYDLPNYVGELFSITPYETPFLSMIGGLTGGVSTISTDITWSTVDNTAAAQPAILENAAPVNEERTLSQVSNVVQIFQYGISVGYSKMAATGNISGISILGNQPVGDELTHQTTLKLQRAARDVEYSFLQGAYQKPTDNTTARKTRGLKNAITTNAVAAASARLGRTHLQSLWKLMADSGAPFSNTVIFANAFQRQQITDVYGYAPEDRNIGGISIKQIETDFGTLGVAYDRFMPTDEVYAVEVSVCAPRILNIPDKGFLFVEPMGKTKAAEEFQLYGEAGLEYGPELWHGKVTGLATS